jgi:hypothetical protein
VLINSWFWGLRVDRPTPPTLHRQHEYVVLKARCWANGPRTMTERVIHAPANLMVIDMQLQGQGAPHQLHQVCPIVTRRISLDSCHSFLRCKANY